MTAESSSIRAEEQNGGAAGGEWLQRNSVFWTQQDSCTYELKAVEKIYTGLAPVHARTECGHRAPVLVKELLALDSCWEGIAFSLVVWPLMRRPPSGEGHTSKSIQFKCYWPGLKK